jgi:predicted lipoprotein with Yx(FWY)xxD motif
MKRTTPVTASSGMVTPMVVAAARVATAALVATAVLALTAAPAPAGAAPVARRPAEIGAKVLVKTATAHKYGKILVDQKGLALYFNKADEPSRWACTGACLVTWPPLLLPRGEAMAQLNSDISGLGVVSGPKGRQVTWHGKPLYTFIHDSPGTVKGEGIAHTWYVVQLSHQAAGANWT